MAFYVPLIIMFATYALSVRILRRNHQLMKLIALGSVRRKGPKPPSDVAAAATTADAAGKTRHYHCEMRTKTRRTEARFCSTTDMLQSLDSNR